MANDLTLAMRLLLDASRFGQGLDSAARKTTSVTTLMERRFGRLGGITARSGVLLNRGLDSVMNRYTALLTGAAGLQAARGVAQLDSRLTRLATQANLSDEQVQGLRDSVFSIAQERDIRVDPSQLIDAIDAIVEKTGDLEFARDNVRNIGLAIQATGAEGTAIGEIVAEMQKMKLASDEVLISLDLLTAQGKEGAFTLQNLAQLGPRVVTAYTALGRTGVPALREMGAALQVIRQGTGSSEQAATAFEAVLRTMRDPQKLKQLRRIGIEVFDAQALREGRELLRPINELMIEIIQKTGGKGTALGRIFDAEAIRAFNAANAEFLRSGQIDSLDRFYRVHADGSTIISDAARNARTFESAARNLSTAWRKFAVDNLAGPIQSLADTLNSVDPKKVEQWMNWAKWLGIGVGSLLLLRGGVKLARDVTAGARWVFTGGRAGRTAAEGIAGAAGGLLAGGAPVPVFVVNAGAFGGGLGSAAAGAGAAAMAARMAKLFGGWRAGAAILGASSVGNLWTFGLRGLLGSAGMLAGAGAAGYGLGSLIYEATDETKFGDKLGEAITRALAFFGNDTARESINSREAYEASVKIELDDQRARVKEMKTNSPKLNMDVYSGPMFFPIY